MSKKLRKVYKREIADKVEFILVCDQYTDSCKNEIVRFIKIFTDKHNGGRLYMENSGMSMGIENLDNYDESFPSDCERFIRKAIGKRLGSIRAEEIEILDKQNEFISALGNPKKDWGKKSWVEVLFE